MDWRGMKKESFDEGCEGEEKREGFIGANAVMTEATRTVQAFNLRARG